MKSLLLKDFYQLLCHFKVFCIVAVLFLVVVAVNGANLFAAIYLSAVIGITPMTLLAYDESSGWDIYAQTLPCTVAQLVAVKYIIGLVLNMAALLVLTLVIVLAGHGWGSLIIMTLTQLIFSLMVMALTLPLSFKFGTNKGRVIYWALMLIFIGIGRVIYKVLDIWGVGIGTLSLLAALGTAIIIYLLSWLLSVRFYKKRQF